MEFKTESQKACYEKVLPWLKEIFGEHFTRVREDAPVIGIVIGSALAQVAVYPWGDNDAIINTRAYVVSGADITPDLMTYLLKENAQKYFGAFVPDLDLGKRMVERIRKEVEVSSPQLLCAKPEVLRELPLDLRTGEVAR